MGRQEVASICFDMIVQESRADREPDSATNHADLRDCCHCDSCGSISITSSSRLIGVKVGVLTHVLLLDNHGRHDEDRTQIKTKP